MDTSDIGSLSFDKLKVIGKGGSSTVFKARLKASGRIVAVKQIETHGLSKESIAHLKGEIEIIRKLKHENIVSYLGTQYASNKIFIFLEFASRGSLRQLYQRKGKLNEAQVQFCTKQILSGLMYLHSKGISHRDLKCANCLVTQENYVKVADFGSSKNFESESLVSGLKGTPNWMAPEVIKGIPMTSGWLKADVWSLGCTVVEMSTGKLPFSNYDNPMTAMYHIANGEAPSLEDLPAVSGELVAFVRVCCDSDPSRRPSVAELVLHQFLVKSKISASGRMRSGESQAQDRFATDVIEHINSSQVTVIEHSGCDGASVSEFPLLSDNGSHIIGDVVIPEKVDLDLAGEILRQASADDVFGFNDGYESVEEKSDKASIAEVSNADLKKEALGYVATDLSPMSILQIDSFETLPTPKLQAPGVSEDIGMAFHGIKVSADESFSPPPPRINEKKRRGGDARLALPSHTVTMEVKESIKMSSGRERDRGRLERPPRLDALSTSRSLVTLPADAAEAQGVRSVPKSRLRDRAQHVLSMSGSDLSRSSSIDASRGPSRLNGVAVLLPLSPVKSVLMNQGMSGDWMSRRSKSAGFDNFSSSSSSLVNTTSLAASPLGSVVPLLSPIKAAASAPVSTSSGRGLAPLNTANGRSIHSAPAVARYSGLPPIQEKSKKRTILK